MSLDQNLFTLHFSQDKDDPNITDLVDPASNAHYRKVRVQGSVYTINVYDPLSQSLLATATAPSATSKHKTIELHNPSQVVELKFAGTLTWKWRFQWEEHEFEWKREECFIIRKPDPAVLVAVTKEPSGRLKTSSVQILDYNLNRFDIHDRKGLEIVILTALLTFQDTNEAYHTRDTPSTSDSNSGSQAVTPPATTPTTTLSGFFGISRRTSETRLDPPPQQDGLIPPPLPPKPEKTGVERIAERHAVRTAQGEGDVNEVQVATDGSVADYALYAEQLLNDEAMLFVTIRSASAAEVPKVLQVVEQTKRLRHIAGLDEEDPLRQYVVYATEKAKGPRRINLDDPNPNASKTYAPPTSLSVHLSKIDMPELQPKMESRPERASVKPPPPVPLDDGPSPKSDTRAKAKAKERERLREQEKEREKAKEREREKERQQEKARKKAEKEAKKSEKNKRTSASQPASPPETNKLTKPSPASIPVIQTSPIPVSPYTPYQPSSSPYRRSSSPYQPPPSPYQQSSAPFQPPSSSLPYQAPPSPSFPQPRPVSTYFSGADFSAGLQAPPTHPSLRERPRPTSFYGAGPGASGSGYNADYYLRQ